MTTSLSRKLLMPALLAALVAPLSLAASASPDHPPHPGEHREDLRQEAFERAGIDQQTRDELKEAREDYRDAMKDLRDEHRQQIDEILGEDGKAALEKAQQQMHEEHRAEQQQAREARIKALFDEWELSDSTREALAQQRDEFRSEAETLKEQEFEGPEERRQAWKDLMQSHRDALSEHLSEQQIEELGDALRPQGHGPGRPHDHGHGPKHSEPMDG
ncbi:hypothetical protein FZZ93_09570 [Halomonas eurihalina]|uniref:Zinc resistance-associated protein n=1 Tax=Halomonas eurihalina TaxID=42566 RepID=A0A5D9D6M7_HALER|nr:hypothetical protein [Halomonas eurihalina]MDR5858921.1 hypothetical protein [Halomonas eurihalina]TZG39426.1 hypothetical protein FZZ93_09570 [Halomonas eurihalina]